MVAAKEESKGLEEAEAKVKTLITQAQSEDGWEDANCPLVGVVCAGCRHWTGACLFVAGPLRSMGPNPSVISSSALDDTASVVEDNQFS